MSGVGIDISLVATPCTFIPVSRFGFRVWRVEFRLQDSGLRVSGVLPGDLGFEV